MVKQICFFTVFIFSLLSRMMAQGRAPHGLAYQNPAAFSPTAYDFFHPNAGQDPCTSSHCAPFPLAAHVQETGATATATPISGTTSFGAGAIAGPAFAAIVIICMVMGVYYVAKTRQANVNRTKTGQPNV